jgi:peptide-methionine (S)-S-oxide reductase
MIFRHFTPIRFCLLGLSVLSVGSIAQSLAGQSLSIAAPVQNPVSHNMTLAAAPPSPRASSQQQTAVFAGGCFWGVEAVFEHVKGVTDAVSGFSGGSAESARYETVSSGRTGHAEAVKVTYNPSQVSYAQLLKVYFSVAHDPTQLNRQGPDFGTQYRSAIFFTNAEQKKMAQVYLDQLKQSRTFSQPIVTQLVPLTQFYAAESYHQNFIARNPSYPYVVINDLPKLAQLKQQFPALYKS